MTQDAYVSRRRLLQTLAAAGGMGLGACSTPTLLGGPAKSESVADRIGPHDRARLVPDRREADAAVQTLAGLYSKFRR